MVRCKTCRVMLDIQPLREKKYRCLGCKNVFSGAIYYKYGHNEAPSSYISAASKVAPLAQKSKEAAPHVELGFEDFLDFELGDLDALAESETPLKNQSNHVDLGSDIFEDLSSMDFSAEEQNNAQKFVQGATQIQGPFSNDLSPESFAPYKIIRQLAQGGMGIIYEAEHPQYGKVALKLLPNSEDVEDVDVHRFVREGETLKNLSHPNIIPFCESGILAKRHYISMKFQEGMTLDKIVARRGKFSPEQAAQMLIPLLSSLSHAHQQNILHRDLKPENIIVDPKGTPLLMDFGIAKLMGEKETKKITAKGTTVGTPAYMPPEQAQGKNLTPATDVYSMGAVLYEMLSGNAPYNGNNAVEIMKNVVHQPLKPLSYHGNFPAEIVWICETTLEKNPAARFQTAEEFSLLLQGFLDKKSLVILKTMVADRSQFTGKEKKFSGIQKNSRSGSRISASRSGARSGVRSGVRPAKSQKKIGLLGMGLIGFLFLGVGIGGTIFFLEFLKQKKENLQNSTSVAQGLNPTNSQTNNPSNSVPKNNPNAEQKINMLLLQAEEAERANNYEVAEKLYFDILGIQRTHPVALLRRCKLAYSQRYVPQAINLLDGYLNLYPKDWEAHELKVKCLKENKNDLSPFEHLFSLIEHLERMKETFPERMFELSILKADAYEELARQGNPQYFDQAVQIYKSLQSQYPKDAKVLTRLGNLYLLYFQKSDLATVIECYTKAAEFAPEEPEIQGNLGVAYILSGRSAEGVPLLERALASTQISKEAEINFLNYIILQYFNTVEQLPAETPGREKLTLQYYQKIIQNGKQLHMLLFESKRENPLVMYWVGQSYFRLGDITLAKEWYNKSCDFYRKNLLPRGEPPTILEKRAEFYYQIKSYTLAIKYMEEISNIYRELNQYDQKKRIDDLIIDYKKAKGGEEEAEDTKSSATEKKETSSENRDPLDSLEDLIKKKD